MNKSAWLLLAVFVIENMSQVSCWGKLGHEMVANIAYERLSRPVQDRVVDILGNHSSDEPLGAVADWADQVRYTKEYHWTTPLHYIDVKDRGECPCQTPGQESSTSCHFNYTRDCKNDVCVAGAINNYTLHLDSLLGHHLRRLQAVDKVKESLMFVTHFIGDIHQPLHSARQSDRGGNSLHVHFDAARHHSKPLNLHSVWDDGIIERALVELYNSTRELFQEDLRAVIQTANETGELDAWLKCSDGRKVSCTSDWAEESLQDALAWAYRNADGKEVVDGSILTDDYYETRLAVVRRRLATASVRLAASLELVSVQHKSSSRIDSAIGLW